MTVYLNRSAGGLPYELHLDIRVNGDDIFDAAGSVVEYIMDHAEEVLEPVHPELCHGDKEEK